MRTMLLASSAMLAFVGGWLLYEHPVTIPMGGFPLVGGDPPITVFLVGKRSGVALVRAVVDPQRIVADSPDALALVEGRIFATNVEAVADPLRDAGWLDRPLELVAPPPPRDPRSATSDGAAPANASRLARLTELMGQPSLSPGEQRFVLQAMHDGLLQ